MKNKTLIREIFNLCLSINEKKEYAVFFALVGHIDSISISIGKNKTDKYNEVLLKTTYIKYSDKKNIMEMNKILVDILFDKITNH